VLIIKENSFTILSNLPDIFKDFPGYGNPVKMKTKWQILDNDR